MRYDCGNSDPWGELVDLFTELTGVKFRFCYWEFVNYLAKSKILEISSRDTEINQVITLIHELGHWFAATEKERTCNNFKLDYYAKHRNKLAVLREVQSMYLTHRVVGHHEILRDSLREYLSETGESWYAQVDRLSSYSKRRMDRHITDELLRKLRDIWFRQLVR